VYQASPQLETPNSAVRELQSQCIKAGDAYIDKPLFKLCTGGPITQVCCIDNRGHNRVERYSVCTRIYAQFVHTPAFSVSPCNELVTKLKLYFRLGFILKSLSQRVIRKFHLHYKVYSVYIYDVNGILV
jgi:hypothetical protein